MCRCSTAVGPMWRAAKSVMWSLPEAAWSLPGSPSVTSPPWAPLQSCLPRPVRVPERFRGCCPFGARNYAVALPAGVIGKSDATRGWPRLWDAGSAGAAQPALGQIVLVARAARRHRDEAVLGPDGRQHGQVALHLAPDPAQRDPEHALAAGQQVDHLVRGGALVDTNPVAHQRHLGQVGAPPVAQVLDRRPDLLERDPGVEQPLDHLEHEDVAEAVQPLGAGPVGGAHARLDQAGTGPAVWLAVGAPGGGAGRAPAVADRARRRALRPPDIRLGRVLDSLGGGTAGQAGNRAVVEEGVLLSGALRAVVTPGYR